MLHGGDLADGGSNPIEIVDRIRDLGWPGVMGNTNEMLVYPDSLEDFANLRLRLISGLRSARLASATRDKLGAERLAWLRGLPRVKTMAGFALLHATPESCWRAPASKATDAELENIYGSLGQSLVVFGHTHRPSLHSIAGHPKLLINSGSVGLSYDGDPRASYLILDDGTPSIRRVEYNLEQELKTLASSGMPGATWTAKMLRTSSPLMPAPIRTSLFPASREDGILSYKCANF